VFHQPKLLFSSQPPIKRFPTARLRSIKAPALIVYGTNSPAFMASAAKALPDTLPDGHVRSLDGQTHDIVPSVLAPVLLEFFGAA
jgi:pimeloyl-ACP methyl ester carboxylesterase